MIDGRGEVRITDFGLAAVAEQLQGAEVRNGTPAYMAPEQLAGREVSVQSDVYALGLVLYEMFTGKPPFRGELIAEMARLRKESPITASSTLVPELDKTAERAILHCLDPVAKNRPASALPLAAMLPGGDPLAEALAAGETPRRRWSPPRGPPRGNPKIAISVLATTLAMFVVNFSINTFLTLDLGAWYGQSSAIVLASLGFKLSLGDRSLFSPERQPAR